VQEADRPVPQVVRAEDRDGRRAARLADRGSERAPWRGAHNGCRRLARRGAGVRGREGAGGVPDCEGAVTTFEMRSSSGEYGSILRDAGMIEVDGSTYGRVVYQLVRCAGCGRAGLATIYDNGMVAAGRLAKFYPLSLDVAPLPAEVPPAVAAEYREAEVCASAGAWRGASALLRSALEKALAANGYSKGVLAARIDEAAADGVITAARQRRAHDEVRSLGNDILHEEWRPVSGEEYRVAHHYVLRILEDFYDQRAEVEKLLHEKKRLPEAQPVETE
jgi:Domain of unknown function (DUF4145)